MKTIKIVEFKKMMVAVLLLTVVACGKYYDPPMIFEEPPSGERPKDRKVLLISIDGLPGAVLSQSVPTNIASLLDNAKYSFDGFSDADTGDAASWTTMMAGTSSGRHGVHGNSYDPEDPDDPDDTHNAPIIQYTTVFQRVLETGRRLKSLSVTSDASTDEYLFAFSDHRVIATSDLAVKDSAVNAISQTRELSFAVVNFRELLNIGKEGGFSRDNGAYVAALTTIDGYVGEIMTALRGRSTAAHEDWMVIVTSNHGADGDSYGGGSIEERTIPVIYHNANFQRLEFEKANVVNSLVISTKGDVQTPTISAVNSDTYDIKNTGEYTIMFKVKNRTLPGGDSHAVILGRTNAAYGSPRGWQFMVQGANQSHRYRCLLGNGSATIAFVVHGTTRARANEWDAIALKIYADGGNRYARIYVNGEPAPDPVDITGRNHESAVANMFVGSGNLSPQSVGTFNGEVNDLVFVNKVLSDEEIVAFSCLSEVGSSVPYWVNVTGYWPMKEGSGGTLANYADASVNTDFSFDRSRHFWSLGEAWACSDTDASVILWSIDLLPQIFYWMNIEPHTSWGLEGSIFLDKFEREFITAP